MQAVSKTDLQWYSKCYCMASVMKTFKGIRMNACVCVCLFPCPPLNVHAPTEGKTDDVKDGFYEELERVFDKFPKYHMKIILGNFNAKVGREDIFKLTIGN
jgi:hypothetical protein